LVITPHTFLQLIDGPDPQIARQQRDREVELVPQPLPIARSEGSTRHQRGGIGSGARDEPPPVRAILADVAENVAEGLGGERD
jgi:hypothetical protein